MLQDSFDYQWEQCGKISTATQGEDRLVLVVDWTGALELEFELELSR